MLRVEELHKFNRFRMTDTSVTTDDTPEMVATTVTTQKISATNQVPKNITRMVDVATQTEAVSEDE